MTDANESADCARAEDLLDLLFVFERLKAVERQNPVVVGDRQENTAEHSWSVALATIVFRSMAAGDIDAGRALALAVSHDLPEAFVGDTFVYGEAAGSRSARETEAMDEFLADGGPVREKRGLVSLWREYESADTPESRYVFALDVLLPVFANSRDLAKSSWKRHGVHAEDVRARVRGVEDSLPQLAQLAYQAIDVAVTRGALLGP